MYKLFDLIFGKNDKTEINVKITHYEAPEIEDPYVNSTVWPCSTAADFAKLYDDISRGRKNLQSKLPEIKIKIELSGKLKGLDIKEKFDDLDSYHLFLEKNELFNKSSLQLVN